MADDFNITLSDDSDDCQIIPDLATRVRAKICNKRTDSDEKKRRFHSTSAETVPREAIGNDTTTVPAGGCALFDDLPELGESPAFDLGDGEDVYPVFTRAAESQNGSKSEEISTLTKTEQRKREAQQRKGQREELKRIKEKQKKEERDRKELEKLVKKANTIGECTKYLQTCYSPSLSTTEAGSLLHQTLSAAEMPCKVMKEPLVPEAIVFKRICPLTKNGTVEDNCIILLEGPELLFLLENDENVDSGVSSLLVQRVKFWRELLGVTNVTIFLWKLDDCFKKKSKKNTSSVTRLDVEMSLITLQLNHRVNHRLFTNAQDLADYVVHIAKAVAQAPYKRDLQDDGNMFSWYAEGSNVCPVKVTPQLVGLKRLWLQQLRQFTSVGLETAQAIGQIYPAPSILIEAYRSLSHEEGSLLLADIAVTRGSGPLQTNRRVGKELSKKVHTFFTSDDAHKILGS